MKKVILLFFKTIAVVLGIFVAFAILFIPIYLTTFHKNTQTIDSIQMSEFVEVCAQAAESSQM